MDQLVLDPTKYDHNGLSYLELYLEDVFPRVAYFQKKDQAKFADAIVQRYATNPLFCEHFLSTTYPYNTTHVGNLAYLTIASPSEFRSRFEQAYTTCIHNIKSMISPTDKQVHDWEKEQVDEKMRIDDHFVWCTLM